MTNCAERCTACTCRKACENAERILALLDAADRQQDRACAKAEPGAKRPGRRMPERPNSVPCRRHCRPASPMRDISASSCCLPEPADDEQAVGVNDRATVEPAEPFVAECIDMMNGANIALDQAALLQRRERVAGYAVLGMENVVLSICDILEMPDIVCDACFDHRDDVARGGRRRHGARRGDAAAEEAFACGIRRMHNRPMSERLQGRRQARARAPRRRVDWSSA